jgi:hypothetical protein
LGINSACWRAGIDRRISVIAFMFSLLGRLILVVSDDGEYTAGDQMLRALPLIHRSSRVADDATF